MMWEMLGGIGLGTAFMLTHEWIKMLQEDDRAAWRVQQVLEAEKGVPSGTLFAVEGPDFEGLRFIHVATYSRYQSDVIHVFPEDGSAEAVLYKGQRSLA